MRNWRVETKVTPRSPWVFTGIIESNKEVADEVWPDIIKRLQHHAYRLFECSYGVPIER